MPSNSCNELSQLIKAEALRLGFSVCGIAPAEAVSHETAQFFRHWLDEECHADMNYMANYLDKRLFPELLMEGTRSIVSVALNYYPEKRIADNRYQIAYYAYGQDYHRTIKEKLGTLLEYIARIIPVNGRIFCDTAPILERYWAWRAGLGWIGRNTQLIIPHAGSYYFLGELFLDIDLDYDTPQVSHCGNCMRCIQACPTSAIEAPYRLNAAKCLSYLTIENRGIIPPEYAARMKNYIYGCDECQKACPHNRFATPCNTADFQPAERLLNMGKADWQALTEEDYRRLFKGSAVKRAKYEGLKRNIRAHDK
jgi:epoxyqueuosine reductase